MIDKDTILTREIIGPIIMKWKSILKLDGWDLSLALVDSVSMNERIREYEAEYHRPADPGDIVLGCVTYCHPVEQVATVQFRRDAPKYFGHTVNLDTLVCHELIHVKVREHFDRLPKAAHRSPKILDLEEFLCDFFSHILDIQNKSNNGLERE